MDGLGFSSLHVMKIIPLDNVLLHIIVYDCVPLLKDYKWYCSWEQKHSESFHSTETRNKHQRFYCIIFKYSYVINIFPFPHSCGKWSSGGNTVAY